MVKFRYKLNENSDRINILGEIFVNNNRNKLKIVYKGKEYDLQEEFVNGQINDEKVIDIELKGLNNLDNLSYMFYGCTSLIEILEIKDWDISNVNDISNMFCGCSSLLNLPDISQWNTSNIVNMSFLFSGCSSLKLIPDISKWNTSKVIDISNMLNDCSSTT